MPITYTCRYCKTVLGMMNDRIDEHLLGFHFLTPEERKDIISYNYNGDVTVNVICDYCKEALETHPELSLGPNPLQ